MKPPLWACPFLLAVGLVGCRAEPGVRLVPVRGRATLGKQALAHVTIQLVPDAKKGTHAPAGVGQTDEGGRFQITTPPHGEGAVPGHYKVTVTSYSGKGVPPNYGDPRKTPLGIEIPPGGLDNWELKIGSP
jgi:hypothetical protein